ncbi:malonyl-CoA decarboxylase, mitochondrial-like isoform X2 [Lineus longissimus]
MKPSEDNIRQLIAEAYQSLENGSVHTEVKIKEVCSLYSSLTSSEKLLFLHVLGTEFSADHNSVVPLAAQVGAFHDIQDRESEAFLRLEERLKAALTPKYHKLFMQIGRNDGGVKFLVDMRADILVILSQINASQEHYYLKSMCGVLKEMVALLFAPDYLQLTRVQWESPGDVIKKISEYEAINPIRSVDDLKRRFGPYRRCYIFTQSRMSSEPVIVLHTALTQEISSNIQTLINNDAGFSEFGAQSNGHFEDTSRITTAVFYSITSTQKGLQGIEFGNYLIPRVISELMQEFPRLRHIVSLSPLPGFRDWLVAELGKLKHLNQIGESAHTVLFTAAELKNLAPFYGSAKDTCLDGLHKALKDHSWLKMMDLVQVLKEPLMRLCIRYLYIEKRRGYALNPVANFHLRNGAMVWQLNWMADPSQRGMNAAFGMMVNYRYIPGETEKYSREYIENKLIEISDNVLPYVKALQEISRKDAHKKS